MIILLHIPRKLNLDGWEDFALRAWLVSTCSNYRKVFTSRRRTPWLKSINKDGEKGDRAVTCRFTMARTVLPDVLFSAKFGYLFIWRASKIRVGRVADFLAIFAIFRQKIWRMFVQELDQCLIHKCCKNPLNIAYWPQIQFSSCVGCLYQCRLFQCSGNPVFS